MSHLTAAVSEGAIVTLFAAQRDAFSFSDSNSGTFSGFTAGYSVACHLENGSVDLRNDGTVQLKELDIVWDTLQGNIGFDIPEICVGGQCIVPNPFDGCWVRLPKFCVFSGNPDISISLDLSGIFTSEVSVTAEPKVRYLVDPSRPPTMDYLDAQAAGIPNHWAVFIDPQTVDVDIIDISETVGDLLENAVDAAIDGLLSWMPQWAKDLVRAILGSVIDVIRFILDIPDDIGEWLSDLINVSLGLLNALVTFVADYFANQSPLVKLEDPLPILGAETSPAQIPVKIPIADFDVTVNDDELILEATVGPV